MRCEFVERLNLPHTCVARPQDLPQIRPQISQISFALVAGASQECFRTCRTQLEKCIVRYTVQHSVATTRTQHTCTHAANRSTNFVKASIRSVTCMFRVASRSVNLRSMV